MTHELNEDQKTLWEGFSLEEKIGLLARLYSYRTLYSEFEFTKSKLDLAHSLQAITEWPKPEEGNVQQIFIQEISSNRKYIERLEAVIQNFLSEIPASWGDYVTDGEIVININSEAILDFESALVED